MKQSPNQSSQNEGALFIKPMQQEHQPGSMAALLAALGTLEPVDHEIPNIDDGLLSLNDVAL